MSKRSFGKPTSNKPRPAGARPQHMKLLIVAEGEVSEPQYFEFVKNKLSAFGVNVKCVPGKVDPLKLVEKALDLRADEIAAYGEAGGFDEAWVAVDVDTHETLDKALKLAKKNNVHMAISNPCFELWLLLHLQSHTSHLLSKPMTELWRKASKTTDKSVNAALLEGLFETAEKHARQNRSTHQRNDVRHPADNPSTNVDLLVRKLLDGARKSSDNPELSL